MFQVKYVDSKKEFHYRTYRWHDETDVRAISKAVCKRRAWKVISITKAF